MKKATFILLAVFAIGLISNVNAQKDRTLSNGFSLQLITGFPSSDYGAKVYKDYTDVKPGTVWGLQLGNRWYIQPQDQYGFGIMVNWIDFNYSVAKDDYEAMAVIDLTFLEFGPIGTYKINEEIAIDGYYNLRPTVFSTGLVDVDDATNGVIAAGTGISHTLGATFRWNVLAVGIEYGFGALKDADVVDIDDTSLKLEKTDLNTGAFKVTLGVKF